MVFGDILSVGSVRKAAEFENGCGKDFEVPFVIREYQATPNPNALKLVLDKPVSQQPMSFLTPAAAESHALAKQLFAVNGVTSVLLLGDFITINKAPQAKWPDVKRKVEQILFAT